MLKLTKLSLSGFKSFPEATQFRFDAGVTAIVGPNGCGKSNVVDAIAWVLGKQSAKSLRSARMSDIIFGGTERRPPLGMAEAVLTLERLSASGGAREEVGIARRVFRDGEAEYTLGGRRTRLQDIRDFLASEGVSEEAYSIIEQGRVDEILSAKPEERRAVLEQAARIGQFKLKRHQTELKLQAARDNLSRVEDIRQEMEKRMTTLKIQAGRARRHQELSASVLALKRVLYVRKRAVLETQYGEADAAWEALKQKDAETLRHITALEADLEARRAALAKEQEEVRALRDAAERVALDIERTDLGIRHNEARLEEFSKRREEAGAEQAVFEKRIAEARAASEAEAKRLGEFREVFDRAQSAADSAQARVEAARREAQETAAAIEEAEAKRLALLDRVTSLRNETARLDEDERRVAHVLTRLSRETGEALAERDRMRESHGALAAERDRTEKEHQKWKEELEKSQEALDSLRREREDLHERLRALRESLQEISIRRAYVEEEEARTLEPLKPLWERAAGKLADVLTIPEALERAAEAFWGGRLEGLVLADEKKFQETVEQARALGAAVTLATPAASVPLPPVPEGLSSLRARVSAKKRRWRPLVEALPDAALVETLDEARTLRASHPSVPFVTAAGEVLDAGGFVRVGRGGRGILSRQRELEELRGREEGARGDAEQLERSSADLEKRIDEAQSRRTACEGEAQRLAQEVKTLEGRAGAVGESLAAWERKCEALEQEKRRLEEEAAACGRRREETAGGLSEAEKEEEALRLESERLSERERELEGGQEDIFEEHTRTREALARERERLHTLEVSAKAAHDALEELERQRRKLEQELQTLAERKTQTEEETEEMRRRLEGLLREKDKTAGDYRGRMEKRTREEGSLADIEKSLSSEHHAYEAFKDTLTKAEVRRAELRRSLEHLRERAAEDFPDESREALDSSLGDEERARPLEEVEQTLEAEEGKLRRLGAVNLLAIEEFKEVEERWTFLTTQRDDILKSVASLEETIRDLDATSSRRFQDAFEAVRGNFQRVFARLFEGGMGDLRLVPEDDYLNGGLEIIAQPPGKKLQSIELLSGGEKALSAIAFLFAAFEYKPSPFCILDEVDAALDDANIERFGKLLRDNAGQVQFICITHNKRTMAVADALYGVTMEEPGVSNVLSVRLDEAPSYAASAAS